MNDIQMTSAGGLKLSRRALLSSIAAVPASAVLARPASAMSPAARSRPGTAGWPSEEQWRSFSNQLEGRLISGNRPVTRPSAELLANPFFVGDQPGLTQTSGWLGAWRSAPSAYAVHASSAADVAAAVRFAARHRLRLVVKGGGHSYLGGSNAPDSLLIWTRAMDRIEIHDRFVPAGSAAAPVAAVSVGAGCIWGRVYRAVCVEAGRYVQGGGCTTVGVAGLVQGGGFGSFSKAFGLAAASLVEAEIVTADGTVRIVNAHQHPDLFWALKGGGGGTFGVVTRLTLETHALPPTFGSVNLTVEARSDTAFGRLLEEFLRFSGDSLVNPHWGEQVQARPDNRLVINMLFQGLTSAEANEVWRPFIERLRSNRGEWTIVQPLTVSAVPGRRFWDGDFLEQNAPQAIKLNRAPGAQPGDYWWAGDGEQVGVFLSAYTSAWLPRSLLEPSGIARLASAWLEASRHYPVSFHFNKGLAGATPRTLARSRETAMNPQVLSAFAMAIIASGEPPAYHGWSDPDLHSARSASARVHAADRALRAAVPSAGSYMSECDYFMSDWKNASWGPHWRRLEWVKRRYDPKELFIVHHGVGSDRWDDEGFMRVA